LKKVLVIAIVRELAGTRLSRHAYFGSFITNQRLTTRFARKAETAEYEQARLLDDCKHRATTREESQPTLDYI
jgi:hypothetical protein